MSENDLVLRLTLKSEDIKKKISEVSTKIESFGNEVNQSFNKGKAGLVTLSSQFGGFGKIVSDLLAPIQNVGKVLKIAFSANPVGIIITAITVLIGMVYSFFSRTQEGGNKMAVIWAGIKGAIQAVLDVISACGAAIFSLITGDWTGFKENWKQIGNEIGNVVDKTKKSIDLQKELIALHAKKFGTVKKFKLETAVDMSQVEKMASTTDKFTEVTLKLTDLSISPEARANFMVKQQRLLKDMSKQSSAIGDGMGVEAKVAQLEMFSRMYQNFSKDSTKSTKERMDYAKKYESVLKSITAIKLSENSDTLSSSLEKFNSNNSNENDIEKLRGLQVSLYAAITSSLGPIKEAQEGINTLKNAETAELVKQNTLLKEQQKLSQEIANRKETATSATAITPENIGTKTISVTPKIIVPDGLESDFTTAAQPGIIQAADNFKQSVDSAFGGLLQGGVLSLAEGLGTAMAGGGFQNMLIGLLDLLKQFGAALIAAGMATIALKTLFANPWVAIASGFALITAVTVAKSKLQSVSNFADGGIVYGETFARVGEYAGAGSNPEVIAPLSKLKQLIKPQSSQQQYGEVRFEIQGQTLVGILNKVNGFNKRM